jgi:predicted RNase H-like nuclease
MEDHCAWPGHRVPAVSGVDGCPGGWIAVTLNAGGAVTSVTVAAALDGLSLACVAGIDMPLGPLGAGWREADRLARRDLTGQGFSVQAWGLRRKIAEADTYRRRASSAVPPVRLYEVHPELSFTAMAGAPLADGKHTRAGLAARRELLAGEGITLPPRVPGAAQDDLLDAAAVAWSARRIAAGLATILTSPSQRADDGGEIAIRY